MLRAEKPPHPARRRMSKPLKTKQLTGGALCDSIGEGGERIPVLDAVFVKFNAQHQPSNEKPKP